MSPTGIVNDDTPALRLEDDRPFVYGTPWSGNGVNNNINAPLEAIVVLERAQQNVMRRLSRSEALAQLMPRCFLPFFDEDFMDLAVSNFEKVVRSVPVYLLQCRPDRSAVDAVYQYLK